MARCPLQEDVRVNPLVRDSSSEPSASIDGKRTQLFFNAEDLIQFGKALTSGGSTGLDLASAQANDDVGNGDIFSLT